MSDREERVDATVPVAVSKTGELRYPHESAEECMAAACGICAPNPPACPLEWYSHDDSFYAMCAIARGGGVWSSALSFDVELDGTIGADEARALAVMLLRAADACDESTREVSALPSVPAPQATPRKDSHE